MHFQYYEMSYGLNVEMHKQTEICKRLDAIIRQVLPFLNGEHQQQVAVAIERAKQINITELQALIQVIYNIVCHPSSAQINLFEQTADCIFEENNNNIPSPLRLY